ncbi:MAG: 2-polyprenyl-3-methyl-6-methoxy-1,4-benzoquinone monooxygenase [Gammaproteobacteria bacterium]
MDSLVEKIIIEIDKGLRFSAVPFEEHNRDYPAEGVKENNLNEIERNHSAGLMRVNHAGEVCAQALYRGQALTADLGETREQMEQAAEEELDHLAWCNKRLNELDNGPSLLNPIWYAMSFSLGALAGLAGDKWSLGFVEETEKQVVKHLEEHLSSVSEKDKKTRVVINQMVKEEEDHQAQAKEAGANELPKSVKEIMARVSKVMTSTSYHL